MSEIKKKEIKEYLETQNSSLNTFRTIILFGRNTATYKFAFCHALLNLDPRDEIKYEDLREEFVKRLLLHYKNNPHQFKKGLTKLTESMDSFLQSPQTESEMRKLINIAEKNIYNNVFDAFQNVGNGTIDKQYQLFEHDRKNRRLILTDNVNLILENDDLKKVIALENESRWRVVEEAWKAGLSPNLLQYDEGENIFYSVSKSGRVGLRSAIDVLLPYQKGDCFYCNRELNIFASTQEPTFPDIDHFLPLSLLKQNNPNNVSPNGVWNLVVSCKNCNRGPRGKFDAPPSNHFYSKLKDRNVLFIEEHQHSLKNSILLSLNVVSKTQLISKMDDIYKTFEMIKGWQPNHIFEANE
jgi:regulator of replication initiation timing